jgi:hypothetical protein
MILSIKEFDAAVNKISDMVSGEKNVPGVMLNISDNAVAVCYSDGHKAFVEKLNAITEDGDIKAKIVFPYEQLVRAVANCRPSGNIKVEEIHFTVSGSVMKISADQNLLITQGEETVTKKMATKTMDIPYVLVDSTQDQKAKLLNRMNYDSIFQVENGDPDVWDRKTLINVLTNASFEKARNIYMSSKIQKVYVINSAFTCAMPIDERTVAQDKIDELRGELSEAGTSNQFEARLRDLKVVIHRSAVLNTTNAKIAASILNKISAAKDAEDDKVYMTVGEGFVNIFNGDDTVGIYMEQAKGSKIHIGSFERFAGFDYSRYQMTFLREFLVDSIKSAVNSSKNEKTAFTFRDSQTTPGMIDLVITSQNAGASVSDTYNLEILRTIDPEGTLKNAVITVSLKSFADMLGQLKSDYVAMDISKSDGDQTCLRLAEINTSKQERELSNVMRDNGIGKVTELPDNLRAKARTNTLDTCQYTMVSLDIR